MLRGGNLYVPSVAQWESAGAALTMETSLPEGDAATLTVKMQAPRVLTLALRRPSWAGDGFVVRLNSRPVPVAGGPGS